MKLVVFNADDFGYSRGINRGIAEAYERGVVTSTSLMVNTPATGEAVALARDLPNLSIGLHVNFTNEAERLVDFYDPRVARAELRRQFDSFVDLMGRLPTHLDSHQHVHRTRECRPAFEELADEHGLHLRDAPPVTYKGGFYGQWEYGVSDPEKVGFEALERILRQEIDGGLYEMCVHPGHVDTEFRSVYHADRERELATLTDPRVRSVLEEQGIRLFGYRDLAAVLAELGEPPLLRLHRPSAQRLTLVPERYAVCRLPPDHPWPDLPRDDGFVSVTRTARELSVVCLERHAPPGGRLEVGWRLLEVEGPLDLAAVGVMAELAAPLARAGVSLFALSTFDTDYLLVRDADVLRAGAALCAAGHTIVG
jgi:chitin disaccharide deacetylase